MERILHDQIYEYFDQQNLFKTSIWFQALSFYYYNTIGLYELMVCQHGPWPLLPSCISRLKKAFDTVNHNILLSKLEMYGFNSKATNLLSCYLSHRTQICHNETDEMFSD